MAGPDIIAAFALKSPAGSTLLTVPSTGFEAITFVRPGRNRRRQVVQGAYNPGEVELASVLDTTQLTLQVRVVGTTYADAQNKYDDLVTAAEQGPGGLIAVTFQSTTRTWTTTGSPNISSRGDREGDILRLRWREEVTITWPVNPYPS